MEMNMVLEKLNDVLYSFHSFGSLFVVIPVLVIGVMLIVADMLYIKKEDIRYEGKDKSDITLWQAIVNTCDHSRTEKLTVLFLSVTVGMFALAFLYPGSEEQKQNCIKAIQLERELRDVVDEEMMKLDANIELQYGKLKAIIVKCKNDIY